MDYNLLAIAVLLTLCGFYQLEAALRRAPAGLTPDEALQPARTALERAWRAEPLQVFMRQLFAVRQARRRPGAWHPGRL